MSFINEPTVLLVRHGRTEFNDPAEERIRGHSDIPISFEGKEGVLKTAKFLKDVGYPFHKILTSPLQRTIMTAKLLSADAKIVPSSGLSPWDLGKLTGEPVKDLIPQLNWYQHHPDVTVPNGESYQTWYDRWSRMLDKMFTYAKSNPMEVVLGVVHSRNLLALPSILGSTGVGSVPVKGGPGPESVTKLTYLDDSWTMEVVWDIENLKANPKGF
jgi:broad specificity phosphatase PhoE